MALLVFLAITIGIPTVGFFLIVFMCWAAKWLSIALCLIFGNRDIIHEFDCKDKQPSIFKEMWVVFCECFTLGGDYYPPTKRDESHDDSWQSGWRRNQGNQWPR